MERFEIRLLGDEGSVIHYIEHIFKLGCVSFTYLPAPIMKIEKDRTIERCYFLDFLAFLAFVYFGRGGWGGV